MRHLWIGGLALVALSAASVGSLSAASRPRPVLIEAASYEGDAESVVEVFDAGSDCGCEIVNGPSCGLVTFDDFCSECAFDLGRVWENTEVFLLGDAFKTVGDNTGTLGSIDNSFGMRAGFNSGIGLGDLPIRAQVGASYGGYDWKGRFDVGGLVPASALEKQMFFTVGLYERSDIENSRPLSWAVVFDEFITDQWGFLAQDFNAGQLRGRIGLALGECNEFGVGATIGVQPGNALIFTDPANPSSAVKAMDQMQIFWHHTWSGGADSNAFFGLANGGDVGDWLFGLNLKAPLNDRVSAYSGFTYVAPSSATGPVGSAEEMWAVSLGLVVSLGGHSYSPNVSGNRGMPLLPVADVGSFLFTD